MLPSRQQVEHLTEQEFQFKQQVIQCEQLMPLAMLLAPPMQETKPIQV